MRVIAAIIAAALCIGGTPLLVQHLFHAKPYYFSDFTVFWTAPRVSDPYDPEKLTLAQDWFFRERPAFRPFAYPPTALLLLKPLAQLSYLQGAILWTACGLFCFSASSLLYGRRALLALFSPMFAMTVLAGQASLFLGSALASGVALLSTRPVVSGALLGIAAAVKPQLFVLTPLALASGRHWRSLSAATLTAGLLVIASLILGPYLWAAWFHSLAAFLREVGGEGFRGMNVASGPLFAPVGIAAVWYVWTGSEDTERRLLTLLAATCLSVPYLMNYDLVAVAPAAAVLLLSRDWNKTVVGAFGFAIFWFSPIVVTIGTSVLEFRRQR